MYGCAKLLKVHCRGEGFSGVDSKRFIMHGCVKHLKVCCRGQGFWGGRQ